MRGRATVIALEMKGRATPSGTQFPSRETLKQTGCQGCGRRNFCLSWIPHHQPGRFLVTLNLQDSVVRNKALNSAQACLLPEEFLRVRFFHFVLIGVHLLYFLGFKFSFSEFLKKT